MKVEDIKSIESESGVIASVILKPELIYCSEQLHPKHFTDPQNAWVYYAVRELARRGTEKVDAYMIWNMLNSKASTRQATDIITVPSLNELFDVARNIARDSVKEYKVVVDQVLDAAFRRDTYNKLAECQRLCLTGSEGRIEQQIYSTLDGVMMDFSMTGEVPMYKDVVDQLWSEIEARQTPGTGIIPFKFDPLNAYVMLERGELVVFGAEQKQGKSMLLLNLAVDLLNKGQRVLYLDSELNSRLFTCRLVSHLSGVEFRRVRSGRYTDEEGQKIKAALAWVKDKNFTHLYMPVFDEQSVYTTIKKVYHCSGLDVLIVDYFKGGDEKDAFASYQSLGGFVDLIKNRVAGELNIAAIGAAQATSTGRLADSAKIARNASTIVMLQSKTLEEQTRDGPECGNKKLFVQFNRNGPQHADGEYIDLFFNGDVVSYESAKQHIPETPY